MKKIIYIFSALAITLTSCGGGYTEETSGTDSTVVETPQTPIDNSIIDPRVDDLSEVIAAVDLENSMIVYFGKEIHILVYPQPLYMGTKFEQDLHASGTSTTGPSNVTINFKTVPEKDVVKDQPYLIKGIIEDIGFSNELRIKEAELIDLPADYKVEKFNPKAISNTAFYSATEIAECIVAWDKKVLTVNGKYSGTTVSKSYDQKELLDARVDIRTPDTEGQVGCSFATEAEVAFFVAEMGAVTIKGECSASLHYGHPYLSNCVLIK